MTRDTSKLGENQMAEKNFFKTRTCCVPWSSIKGIYIDWRPDGDEHHIRIVGIPNLQHESKLKWGLLHVLPYKEETWKALVEDFERHNFKLVEGPAAIKGRQEPSSWWCHEAMYVYHTHESLKVSSNCSLYEDRVGQLYDCEEPECDGFHKQ